MSSSILSIYYECPSALHDYFYLWNSKYSKDKFSFYLIQRASDSSVISINYGISGESHVFVLASTAKGSSATKNQIEHSH